MNWTKSPFRLLVLVLALVYAASASCNARGLAAQHTTATPTEPVQGKVSLLSNGAVDSLLTTMTAEATPVRQIAIASILEHWLVRRLGRGEADVHEDLTDIAFIRSGRGTLTSGGILSTPRREVAPRDWRAPGIIGGHELEVRAGDLVTIPAGTPHQWSAIGSEPLVYVTLKVPRR